MHLTKEEQRSEVSSQLESEPNQKTKLLDQTYYDDSRSEGEPSEEEEEELTNVIYLKEISTNERDVIRPITPPSPSYSEYKEPTPESPNDSETIPQTPPKQKKKSTQITWSPERNAPPARTLASVRDAARRSVKERLGWVNETPMRPTDNRPRRSRLNTDAPRNLKPSIPHLKRDAPQTAPNILEKSGTRMSTDSGTMKMSALTTKKRKMKSVMPNPLKKRTAENRTKSN